MFVSYKHQKLFKKLNTERPAGEIILITKYLKTDLKTHNKQMSWTWLWSGF